MKVTIKDKATKKVIGRVYVEGNVTHEELLRLAGLEWVSAEDTGGEMDGWTNDGGRTIWDGQSDIIVESK